MNKAVIFGAAIVAFTYIVSVYFYPLMPATMVSHWNAAGQADGHMDKLLALFLVPAIAAFMLLLFVAMPRIDPLKENVKKFMTYYERFILLMLGFFLYIHIITILLNMGYAFNIIQALAPAFGILLYYCGVLVAKAKRNWFIGIRTPWTMSSDRVWDKTHRFGGRLFKAAGLMSLIGAILYEYAIILILVPVIVFSVCMVVYSYVEYQKEKK